MTPSPHSEIVHIFMQVQGGGHVGKYCSFGVVYFDQGDGGMQINHFCFFSPQGTFVPCL